MMTTAQMIMLAAIVAINAVVMALVIYIYFIIQKKVDEFTKTQNSFSKLVVESLGTFSEIYAGMEAKINTARKGITDTLRLEMLTARMVLEIRQSLSAFISSMNPGDALEEGTIAGRAEEALAMAKKETTKPASAEDDDEPTEVADEIAAAAQTPIPKTIP